MNNDQNGTPTIKTKSPSVSPLVCSDQPFSSCAHATIAMCPTVAQKDMRHTNKCIYTNLVEHVSNVTIHTG